MKTKKGFTWPYGQNRTRLRCMAMLTSQGEHGESALQAAQKLPGSGEVINGILYMLRIKSDVLLMLSDAGQGASDDMQHALSIIHELRAGLSPNAIEEADRLLAKYDAE